MRSQSLTSLPQEVELESPEALDPQISALEQRLIQLEKSVNNNTDVFIAGFESADARIAVMYRVMHEKLGIEFGGYFTEYYAMQALVCLAENFRDSCQDDIESATDVVFGGDT